MDFRYMESFAQKSRDGHAMGLIPARQHALDGGSQMLASGDAL
ncbi:MAG: hypothetical protein RID07_10710 [Lacipirellulaceae bacterium]